MRDSHRIGVNTINKVLTDYPNMFFTLHEGVTVGTNVASCADENVSNNLSGGWKMMIAQPSNSNQWETAEGMWQGAAGNTTDAMYLMRFFDEDVFDSIFDIKKRAALFCCHVQRIGTPVSNGRLFAVAPMTTGNGIIEVRFLTGNQLQAYYYGTGITAVTLDGDPSDVIMMAYYDTRDGGAGMLQTRVYTPGTTNLETTPTYVDISAVNPSEFQINTAAVIGANKVGSTLVSFADSVRIRRVRMINFDQSPPSDISELMDELAINNLLGSRR